MTKDGQNSATADLDMGGNKLTNGKTATLVGDFPIVSDIQNSVHTYVTSTGAANAYVITLSPAPAALAAGQPFSFKANFANTGAVTLNVNSLGAKDLKRYGSIALVTGEIRVDQIVTARYDGTQYQALSINDVPVPVASKFGALIVQNTADDGYELLSSQGTSDQVLTSNGADALPTFQNAKGSLTLLETQVASSSASIDFTSLITSVHKNYLIICSNVVPATSTAKAFVKFSTNNGSSFLGSNYDNHVTFIEHGTTGYAAIASDTVAIGISNAIGSAAIEGYSGNIFLFDPLSAVSVTKITMQGYSRNASGVNIYNSGSGAHNGTDAVNAIQILFSSGNIASGVIKLYGIL